MTAQPLAPVIPSSAVPAGRQRARATEGPPLPLACPEPRGSTAHYERDRWLCSLRTRR